LFISIFLGVAAVIGGLLFREVPPESESMTFVDFYVSYLGIYQASSSEMLASSG
jgi:hypothetical protein